MQEIFILIGKNVMYEKVYYYYNYLSRNCNYLIQLYEDHSDIRTNIIYITVYLYRKIF